jgi:hypothetical protein
MISQLKIDGDFIALHQLPKNPYLAVKSGAFLFAALVLTWA